MKAFKLTTWNCEGVCGRKHARILELEPDVLVFPECGNLTDIPQALGAKPLTGAHWVGENRTKGLAVLVSRFSGNVTRGVGDRCTAASAG